MHHGLHVITREAQLVSEEKRPHKRQLLKFCQSDRILQELPLGLQREELVDELLGVRQEVVVVVLVPSWKQDWFRTGFKIFVMQEILRPVFSTLNKTFFLMLTSHSGKSSFDHHL